MVGSAPSVLSNKPGLIDSFETVVRVNNYRLTNETGARCDVFFSFFGSSIRKRSDDLIRDGVRLCWCACPNSKPIASEWHERNKRTIGIDFRYIYSLRAPFWFCDTYIPDDARFVERFETLQKHIPSTGFAAVLDIVQSEPRELYMTGFDFFSSGIHNVWERWRPGDPSDPIKHRPDLELGWLRKNATKYPLRFDKKLQELVRGRRGAV